MSNLSGVLVLRSLRCPRLRLPASTNPVEVLAVGTLLAFALLLRVYDLGTPSLWMDEAITAEAAKGVLEHGFPVLPSDQSYTRGLLNTYIVAASFKLLGVSEFAGRLPSVAFGTATVAVVYLLGTALGGRRVGIIAAVILAVTDWDIAMSRQARMYAQLEFFFWASLLTAHWFVLKVTWPRGALIAALTLGAILSHEFGFFLPVLFVVLYLLSPRALGDRRSGLIALAVAAPVVAAMAATLFLLHGLDIARDVLRGPANYSDQYFLVLRDELGPLLFLAAVGTGVLAVVRWRTGLFLAVAAALPFYVLSVHVYLFATRYLHFLMPVYALFGAFALDFVGRSYPRLFRNAGGLRMTLLANVGVAVLLALVLVSEQFTLAPKTEYDLGFHAPQPPFKEAADVLRSSIEEGDVVVAAWTPLTHYYLGQVDYWLAFDVLGIGTGENINAKTGLEVYTGAIPVKDRAELGAVRVGHLRGWVVLDDTVWSTMALADRDFLDEGFSRMHGGPFEALLVWSWDDGP